MSNSANHPSLPANRDILVCIFQRGAADGLNALVPYGDANYAVHRPTIQVPAPNSMDPSAAIDIDNFFGLHTALAPLEDIYNATDLAFVHATGMPHDSRSHFAAQGLIERGVTDKSGPFTGWLGRHLALTPPASDSAFRIVSISGNVPVSLTGATEPLAISNLGDFGIDQGIIDLGYTQVLTELFRSPVPFNSPASAALAAMEELAAADLLSFAPPDGLYLPDSPLANKLKQVGQLIKSDLPVEVVCLDSDGWDHHERLPEFINASLAELAAGLSAFYTDMGTARMQQITVLVYTEFGRRIKENGSIGTDHGTGSLAYLMGGGVNGGQIHSNWPGLEVDITNPAIGEDLLITTDLREVLTEMLNKRFGGPNFSNVFPGFTASNTTDLFNPKL